MLNKILPLTRKFISIKSTFDRQKALDDILETALSPLTGFTVERFTKNGINSVLVYRATTRPARFKIILTAHLDVVPGKDRHYQAVVNHHKLFGVGAWDMKAGAACLITTFKTMVDKVSYPLGLQLVTDEEVGGFCGTKHQINSGVRADFVITGEPTNLNIVNRTKGILCLKITCRGKTAHSAYPWKGENAILKMTRFLAVLGQKFPPPVSPMWQTTVNVSQIATSNTSFNKIPDDCTVWLDIRFIPKVANTILGKIQKLLPSGFKATVIVNEPASFVNANNIFLKRLQKTTEDLTGKKVVVYGANGSSDVRHFIKVNCPGIEFGPKGENIGSDNEWVDISSLETYCSILKNFLLSLN